VNIGNYSAMPPKSVSPSISAKSFSCPHCGAHADQAWFEVGARPTEKGVPQIITRARLEEVKADEVFKSFDETKATQLLERLEQEATGEPSLRALQHEMFARYELENIHVSRCYTCGDIAI
jgi:hypothetical protein